MKKNDINKNYENQKLDNNFNYNQNEENKFKNILSKDKPEKDFFMMDEKDIKKINEEIENLKQNQKDEIDSLERELNELKEQNAEWDIEKENNNINLNDNMINKLKEDIINQIQPKLTEELKMYKSNMEEQLKELNDNNQKEYIEKKFEKIKHNVIIPEIEKIKKKLLNEKNPIKNQNNNEELKKIEKKLAKQEKDGKIKTNNISSFREDNEINPQKKNKDSPNLFKFKDDDNNLNNLKGKKKKKENEDINKINNLDLLNTKKKEGPIKLQINEFNAFPQNNLIQKKNSNENLFPYFNNIFFKNKEQTKFKAEKIDENHLKYLYQKFIKYQKENRQNDLLNYFDAFLKSNVFKIFERENEDPHLISIIRYNIETILECFGLNKYTYYDYYFPSNNKTDIRDRKKSTKAAIKFRKVFNIDETIIKEEELLKRLDKNDNDINKVFQQMYG